MVWILLAGRTEVGGEGVSPGDEQKEKAVTLVML
jgi:hypothetical protein